MPSIATQRLSHEVEMTVDLMSEYAERTGLAAGVSTSRYLWTDALAVCNYLSLARATGNPAYAGMAVRLVDAVHATLGKHRPDDTRRGWLSGLSESLAARHPTAGGLRIGKPLPERRVTDAFDEDEEWDRDGQYFHYLTRWMHALSQVGRFTRETKYERWARELAAVAHRAFVRDGPRPRMCWKMSVDLTRPLVASMGQHDPLDGLITVLELRDTAERFGQADREPALTYESESFASILRIEDLTSVDPLALGGLLHDASRLAQLGTAEEHDGLLMALLAVASYGLQRFDCRGVLRRPAERRLAFRELGLAIGLKALAWIAPRHRSLATNRELAGLLTALEPYLELVTSIDAFWLTSSNQESSTWRDHQDINTVTLATSLLPDAYVRLI